MNRFLLFIFYARNANGGWDDLAGSFKSIQAAKDWIASSASRETVIAHIVDIEQGEIVLRFFGKNVGFRQIERWMGNGN